jgi:hypothetical protein
MEDHIDLGYPWVPEGTGRIAGPGTPGGQETRVHAWTRGTRGHVARRNRETRRTRGIGGPDLPGRLGGPEGQGTGGQEE